MARSKSLYNTQGDVPLAQRILAFVEKRGEVTSLEVLSGVGKYVSAPQAVLRGRGYLRGRNAPGKTWHISPDSPAYRLEVVERIGRRVTVAQCLRYLCREGKIQRLGVARYGRLTVHLYEETA